MMIVLCADDIASPEEDEPSPLYVTIFHGVNRGDPTTPVENSRAEAGNPGWKQPRFVQ
jgi:hypothetical protein